MLDFRAHYDSNPKSVATARRAILEFFRLSGLGGDLLSDIELAVGEALANAAEHAAHGGATRFDVHARIEAAEAIIEVRDNGRGFDLSGQIRPAGSGLESLRGYGTSIMRAVMDRVEYKFGGTSVLLVKRLPADAAVPKKKTSGR